MWRQIVWRCSSRGSRCHGQSSERMAAEEHDSSGSRWMRRVLFMALLASVLAALACAQWFTRNRLIQVEPVRKDSEARVGMDANQTLLHSALKRAPAECHAQLEEGWRRVERGILPESLTPHAISRERCSARTLQADARKGDGKIRALPSHGRIVSNYSVELQEQGRRHVADQGEPMAFVVIVSAEQTFSALVRLLHALDGPGHSYLVHVDAKAPEALHSQAASLPSLMSDARALRVLKPISVSWGGPSMLRVELEAIRELLGTGRYWRHVLVLSGSDYPLRTVDEMSASFARLGPFSHFEIFYQHDGFLSNRGYEHVCVECAGWTYRVRSGKAKPSGIDLWGGSSWVTLSRAFSFFVVQCLFEKTQRDPHNFFRTAAPESVPPDCRLATELLAVMEHTQSAEELYLHTLFMNSEHCLQIHTSYFRWVHWGNRKGRHCNRSDSCGTSPQNLGPRQVLTAYRFTPAMFARKFASTDSTSRDLADSLIRRLPNWDRLQAQVGRTSTDSAWERAKGLAVDGNEYSAWRIPPHALVDAQLRLRLNTSTHVCSATVSVQPDSVGANGAGVAIGIYHRSSSKQKEWNTTLPSRSLSAAQVEAEDEGWVLYRLFFPSEPHGVRAKYFELRMSEAEEGTTATPRPVRTLAIFEFHLHACLGTGPSTRVRAGNKPHTEF